MKTHFLKMAAVLALCLGLRTAVAQVSPGQINYVPNPSFESRKHEPEGYGDIAPNSRYDDLFNWINAGNTPDYVTSTTPVTQVNTLKNITYSIQPDYTPFYPRTGTGCAQLYVGNFLVLAHEYIGQEITGLTPGRQYTASFYVLRRPTSDYKAKLSLTVHSSTPAYVRTSSQGTGGTYELLPAPLAKITSLDYITDTHNWTLVSGTFTAPAASVWIAIGPEGPAAIEDTSIEFVDTTYGTWESLYEIDDVSIVDATVCPQLQVSIVDHNGIYTNGGYIEAVASGGDGTYTFEWYIDQHDGFGNQPCGIANGVGCFSESPNSSSLQLSIGSYTRVTCIVTSCGRTETVYWDWYYWDPMYRQASINTAYPNPASESLTAPQDATEAVLLNTQSRVVARPDKFGKLDVRDLPAGLYNLRMKQKGKFINQRIEVKH